MPVRFVLMVKIIDPQNRPPNFADQGAIMNRKTRYLAAIFDKFNLQAVDIRQKLDIIFVFHFPLPP